MNRVRSVAFPEGSPLLGPVHVLDLDKAGYIKPHIDSVKVGFFSLHPDKKKMLISKKDNIQYTVTVGKTLCVFRSFSVLW